MKGKTVIVSRKKKKQITKNSCLNDSSIVNRQKKINRKIIKDLKNKNINL